MRGHDSFPSESTSYPRRRDYREHRPREASQASCQQVGNEQIARRWRYWDGPSCKILNLCQQSWHIQVVNDSIIKASEDNLMFSTYQVETLETTRTASTPR